MFREGKGHIVTLSSILGLVGAAQMSTLPEPDVASEAKTVSADYCASKAALVNLHQSLRFELDSR